MKMNNHDLDQLLKRAAVPEREPAYWDAFASQVRRQLARSPSPLKGLRAKPRGTTDPTVAGVRGESVRLIPWIAERFRASRLVWGIGLASACIVIAVLIGSRKEDANAATQLASMEKYYREVTALFPNQIQAVVLDEHGPHLVLAETPNVPNSNPILLTVCQAKHCQKFITFSGQQIQINAEKCDVLADAQGHVILAGQKLIWDSASAETAGLGYRIQARLLERSL